MECANCGTPISEGSEACEECGLPVVAGAAAAAGAAASSAESGPDVTAVRPPVESPGGPGPGAAGTGGAGVGFTGMSADAAGGDKPVWKRTWFWVVVAVVVVAIVAILAVVLTRGVSAPSVVGLSSAEAKTEAETAGMVYVVRGIQFTTAVAPGLVTIQYPTAGTAVEKGDQLSVLLSTNVPVATVPDVVGQLPLPAVNALEAAGFVISGVKGEQSTEPRGTVLAQDPAAGTQANIGSGVALTLSQGPPTDTVAVPNLVGMQQNVAEDMLAAMGLTGTASTTASSAPQGEVVAQSPAAGTSVAPGASVAVVVSDGSTAPVSTAPPTTAPPTTAPPTTAPPTTATPTTVAPATTTTSESATTTTSESPTTSTTVVDQVTIINLAFDPASITVNAGDTVTWVNEDTTAHTIVADDGSFDSGSVAPGESFQFTFAAAGAVPYHCGIHPSMTGAVVVQ
jgi:beta-lactam-binding protein with PASTA domain